MMSNARVSMMDEAEMDFKSVGLDAGTSEVRVNVSITYKIK
jgi:hypothetical protein